MSGFFGVISKDDCVRDLFYGTDYHSHLGTQRAGMAVYDIKTNTFTRSIHNIENSYFRTKFESELNEFYGNSGIGIISDTDNQPIIIDSHLGRFAIVTVCRINNIKELSEQFLKEHHHFSEISSYGVNPTELISMIINNGSSFKDGIESVFNLIKGSCSIIILNKDGIIIARDKLGRTPIILGKREDGYAVASETTSFFNLGFEIEKFLEPGEIIFITNDGYQQIRKPNEKMQICAFLWVYYGYPSSYYENINVEECRYKCGRCLAKNDDIDIDFVTGIPDSGIAHAIGYSNERKIPYKRAYVKYTQTWPRSFMPQEQKTRDLIAKMKLIPIVNIVKDKRIVICDDSIVRGTQLKEKAKKLYDCGAKSIHIRVACPPLIYPCEFLNFSRSRSSLDLAGRKAIKELEDNIDEYSLKKYSITDSKYYNDMIEKIREKLGIETIKYQKLNDLVSAIGLPKDKICTHCWDGTSYF